MKWFALLSQLDGQTKQKLQGLDHLQEHVQEHVMHKDQVGTLLDLSYNLLSDNNFKVALKLLHCWERIAINNSEVIRPYIPALLPPVVERLGDNRQDVRQAACNLLLELLQVQRPDAMMEKLNRFWAHKHWKVRHGLLQFVAEAVSTTGEAALLPPKDESSWVLHKVIQLVGDPESAVRDAAIECLEEVYKVYGEHLIDIINRHDLRAASVNAIYARLAPLGADVASVSCSSTGFDDQSPTSKHSSPKRYQQQLQQQQQQHHHQSYHAPERDECEEHDTACSAQSAAVHNAAEAECQEYDRYSMDEEEDELEDQISGPPSPQQAPRSSHPYSSNAMRQHLPAVAPEDSSVSASWEACKSASMATAGANKVKRGGYKDGGGFTSDGVLPQAEPLYASSERELRGEMEQIMDILSKGAAAVDWEKRVAALLRLEGLVKGGAAGSFEVCFLEHLRQLRDPILEQMGDRRSAVARQAAHLMETLAAALGQRFESYATVFMTALFKALVITVQVVSEAADTAAKGILHHCHAAKLVPCVCDTVTKDKNAKLRQHCSVYLVQILEEWEPQEYHRSLDTLEAAITAAVQDAISDTRNAGRAAFAAYNNSMPERAAALLRRLDHGMQQKLHEAITQYSNREGRLLAATNKPGSSSQGMRQPPGRAARAGTAPADLTAAATTSMGPPPAVNRPPRAGRMGSGGCQRAAVQPGAGALGVPGSGTFHAADTSAVAGGGGRPGRKSVAGMPMRVPGSIMADHVAGNAVGCPSAVSAGQQAVVTETAGGGRRRASVLPQRVPYQEPQGLQGGHVAAQLACKTMLVSEAAKVSLPNSPDSDDKSGASTADSRGAVDHASVSTRLFDQPKQQQPAAASSAHRTCSAADDLQLLNSIRDQQQQQMQMHYEQQQQMQLQQQQYLAQFNIQHSMAPSVAGLPGLQQQQQRPVTLAKAVAGVMANSKDWKERVEKMSVLAEVLTKQAETAAPGEAYAELEKALPKLLAAADDPHFKVSLAALAALQVCLNTAPHTLEASLDKLMPLLFLKLCGTKQSVRSAAEGALQACALRLDADSLLTALVRSLEAMKQPAARVSVMEFTVLFLGPGKVAGVPTAAGQIRQWIGKNIPLLLDKNPNVRQMAGKALYTMLLIDPNSVAACLQHASAQEVMAVQRSLAESEAAHQADEQAAGASSIAGLMEQAGLPSWAAHRSTWGTGDRSTGSACSSMDMSTTSHGGGGGTAEAGILAAGMSELAIAGSAGFAVAGKQHMRHGAVYAAVSGSNLQGGVSTGGILATASGQQYGGYKQPAAFDGGVAAAAGMPGVHSGQLTMHQQQQHLPPDHQEYDQTGLLMPSSASSSPDGTARAGAAAHVMDVLGRPVPASAGAAAGYPHHGQTPAAPGRLAGPAAEGSNGCSNSYPAVVAVTSAPAESGQPALLTSLGSEQIIGHAAATAAAAAAAAGDAGSQARHLTVLVHRLQSKPGEDVLAELAACAGTICRQAWVDNFSKVLLAGLSAAQHTHEPIRELAYLLVLALAQHHGDLFEPVLDVVLQPLLQGCADASREVLMAAQQALDVLMAVMPPLRCVDILSHKLPSDAAVSSGTAVEGDVLCATVRCLQLVCRQMRPADLLAVAPEQLLPGLFAAFQHSRPDVRKAVVFCLVDMWHAAGNGLTPYLASLSTSQLKLLTIYYNRTQQKQQQPLLLVEGE